MLYQSSSIWSIEGKHMKCHFQLCHASSRTWVIPRQIFTSSFRCAYFHCWGVVYTRGVFLPLPPMQMQNRKCSEGFFFFLREGWSFKARCPRRNTFQGKSITANYIDCGKRFVTREPELPRTNGKYHTMQVATARPIRFLVQGKFRVDFYALCTA